MKLQNKINRRFLFLLLVVFSLAGVVLYFVLGYVVDVNLDEVLRNRADKIIRTLKIYPEAIDSSISLDQSIDIYKIPPTESYRIYSDTIVFDSSDNEFIDCRKVTFTTSAGSTYYKICITLSRLETEDMVQLIFYFMVGLFLLIILTLFILNRLLSSSLWHPFFNTLFQLKIFRIEQKEPVRFEDTSVLEFQQLNNAVAGLFQKAQTDFKNLKEFTENASHEIQTPLAIIRSKTESLLTGENLTSGQHQQLQVVYKAATRLSKLNEALLLLSKIENQQFAEETEVDLSALIEERLDFIEELIELKKVKVTRRFEAPVRININLYLAEILVNNLLGNALKHNIEGGIINIQSEKNQIVFSNSGNPLTIEPNKLFHRFVKQGAGSESTGLGLAIVAEICKNYRIGIGYEYRDKLHCIKLTFNKRENKKTI